MDRKLERTASSFNSTCEPPTLAAYVFPTLFDFSMLEHSVYICAKLSLWSFTQFHISNKVDSLQFTTTKKSLPTPTRFLKNGEKLQIFALDSPPHLGLSIDGKSLTRRVSSGHRIKRDNSWYQGGGGLRRRGGGDKNRIFFYAWSLRRKVWLIGVECSSQRWSSSVWAQQEKSWRHDLIRWCSLSDLVDFSCPNYSFPILWLYFWIENLVNVIFRHYSREF